jgi:adenine-specific DNA-methyltransferase
MKSNAAKLARSTTRDPISLLRHPLVIWQGDTLQFLRKLPRQELFSLVLTSPPYNLGKSYEKRDVLERYLKGQAEIIEEIIPRLRKNGSICWQVGNFVENGEIIPLDIELHPIFKRHNLRLRNRLVWRFGHGHHNKRRFSGRYEVIMWYTAGDNYVFNLDAVRVPAKYPAKRHFRGTRKGEYSSHPLGKNPEDVWDMDLDVWQIPNVKSNHVEKTEHPCQFPVGLAERLVLALTRPSDLVFDPFTGVGSTGVASAVRNRRFVGCEIVQTYASIAQMRITAAMRGALKYRPFDRPLYDHRQSPLSIPPLRSALDGS